MAKASIIKNASDQFHIFLIPNHVEPNKNADKLNEKINLNSVSAVNLILEINGKSKFFCQLKRHLSPKTVSLISRSLPIQSNAHKMGNSVIYIQTTINSGIERPRTEFKKGDIAFMPYEGSICFFFSDSSNVKPMSLIGKIIDNIDNLKEIKSSDMASLYFETG